MSFTASSTSSRAPPRSVTSSGCSRCAALAAGLRATRRLAAVPLVEVPAGLEDRILRAAREAQKVVPLRRRVARVVSVGGSWAMRPQSAMAAVFMVMLGTSLLLLRGRSSRAPASAEVTVTEHGTPAPAAQPAAAPIVAAAPDTAASASAPIVAMAARVAEPKPAAAAPAGMPQAADQPIDDLRAAKASGRAPARDDEGQTPSLNAGAGGGFAAPPPPAAPAAAAGGAVASQSYARQAAEEAPSPFDAALRLYQSGRFDEAARAFEPLAAQDVNADLYEARSIREGKGCRAAVARFDRVAQRATGTPPGWDSLLEGALCFRSLGDFGNARVRLTPLLSVDSHKDRARSELESTRAGAGSGQRGCRCRRGGEGCSPGAPGRRCCGARERSGRRRRAVTSGTGNALRAPSWALSRTRSSESPRPASRALPVAG